MENQTGSRWTWLLALLPVALGLLLLLADSRLVQTLRHYQFDQFQRWSPRHSSAALAPQPHTPPVRIVDIDEASLARLGQWPWPRTHLAALLDQLGAAGAAVVAFDILFAEPDRTAPRAAADVWHLQGTQRAQLLALPDHDTVFARSLQQTPAVLGFALLQDAPAGAATAPLQKFHWVYADAVQPGGLHHFASTLAALPALQQAARGNGALSFVPDGDGVVRRVPLLLQVADTTVATLVTETLRVAQGAPNLLLKGVGQDSGVAELRIGQLTLPTTPQGEMWLHYSAPGAARVLPAWKLLAGQVPPGQLAGAIVLVGSSAQGLMDLRFSPLGLMPGVEVHAQAIEQALGGHFLLRPAWARGLEAVWLLLGGWLVAVLALRWHALRSAAACVTLLLALWAAAWWAFAIQGCLLDAATPSLGWLLCYGLCSLLHHQRSERQQRWIAQAFARYVSPNRVAWLLAHPQACALGRRRQVCSFVFTDLGGFTPLLEGMDPAQAVGLLNAYLDQMVAIAFAHEGTLDRIVGDAVAIMFSAPLEQADHRQRALACALEMDAFACRYAAGLQQQGIAFGQTRIGVHCGEVIVGNFGGNTVFDYRALGDAVNTAARLERVNKQLGTRVCISEAMLAPAMDPARPPPVQLRPVGQLLLQGKTRALSVLEPLCPQDATQAPLPNYLAAFQAMQTQQPQALVLFAHLALEWPHDALVHLHHSRLAAGERGAQMVMREK
jgi:adenylate cyclase